MRTADTTIGALLVGVLAVICCAGPLLIAMISTSALAAWFFKSAHLLIPAAAIGIGVVWFRRRSVSVQDCCRPKTFNKASQHE